MPTINVGPGLDYETPNLVPWDTLTQGTQADPTVVQIHYRPAPYLSKFPILTNHVHVVGVPNLAGDLPILDGNGAVEFRYPTYMYNFGNEVSGQSISQFGLITICPIINSLRGSQLADIVIQNLKIQNVFVNILLAVTDYRGQQFYWPPDASGIWGTGANGVTIQGCYFYNNNQSMLLKSADDQASVIANVKIYDNTFDTYGVPNSQFQHGTYNECQGIKYQGNKYLAGAPNMGGTALKDRSSGCEIRNNQFGTAYAQAGGSAVVDLCGPEDAPYSLVDPPGYKIPVVGNVFYGQAWNGSLVWLEDDRARNGGALLFDWNTCWWWNSGGLSSHQVIKATVEQGTTVYGRDNIVHGAAPSSRSPITLVGSHDNYPTGQVYLGANAISWDCQLSDQNWTVTGAGNAVYIPQGVDPFTDSNHGVLSLAPGTIVIGSAVDYTGDPVYGAGFTLPSRQAKWTNYVLSSVPRTAWTNPGTWQDS